MLRTVAGGLCAFFAVSCGAHEFREQEEDVAISAEELSVPKGQIALAGSTDNSTPTIFMSWGWLYWSSLIDTQGRLSLLYRTSTYPKALAAVYTSGQRVWVFWIEGSQVRSLSKTPLTDWGGVTSFGSTSLFGGTLTRIVGTEGPALVGLTSNGKVVTRWFKNGAWEDWCISADYGSIIPEGADLTAYRHNNGILAYAVNSNSKRNGRNQVEIGFIHRECSADNQDQMDASTSDATLRLSADGAGDGVVALPIVFSLNSDGQLQNNSGDAFHQPASFRAFVHRARSFSGQVRDSYYAVDVDGNAWRSVETVRPNLHAVVTSPTEWNLLP